MEYTKYYYFALTPDKRRIYRILYQGLAAKETVIDVPADPQRITSEELVEIVTQVYNDTPMFYYFKASLITWSVKPDGYLVHPNYIYSSEQIDQINKQIENGLSEFKRKYIFPMMSEYEKEKAIHDYLVNTVTYDYEALNSADRDYDEIFNILGALQKKKAVCWGIACAFKLLCDYCHIKSFVVIGKTVESQDDIGHAWNIVKIEGENYHVDVTWDLKEKGDITFCYDYFNLDDKLIRQDHTWESNLYPPCDAISQNYYYKNRLYVKTIPDLSAYVAERLRIGEQYIAVKFANTMPPEMQIKKAIQSGFLMAQNSNSYNYLISERTHNIYIEIVSGGE